MSGLDLAGILVPGAGFLVVLVAIVILARRLRVDRWSSGIGIRALPGVVLPPDLDPLCAAIEAVLRERPVWKKLERRLVLQFHPVGTPIPSPYVPLGTINGAVIHGTLDTEGVLFWKKHVAKVHTAPTALGTAAVHEIARHLVPFLERGDLQNQPGQCAATSGEWALLEGAIETSARMRGAK